MLKQVIFPVMQNNIEKDLSACHHETRNLCMRFLIQFSLVVLYWTISLSGYSRNFNNIDQYAKPDTGIIMHKNDGQTTEWPASKFAEDVSTDIRYAIDNDNENLYLALNIPNEGIQMKLEKTGMNLFIDLKGKRKEGRGVAFPIKDEAVAAIHKDNKPAASVFDDIEGMDKPDKKVDKKTAHSVVALHLNYMTVFGFEGIENHDQGLKMPGSINIAFAWDTMNALHIEYIVPLKMLDNDIALLKQKEISIGWKINGIYPSDKNLPPGGGHRQRATAGAAGNSTNFDASRKIISRETIVRENNFWTHYTVNL
jgi:hypothetical protein